MTERAHPRWFPPPARRIVRRAARLLAVVVLAGAMAAGTGWVALTLHGTGTPAAAARGTGHDAEWLGHAWVDGRKGQSDVDALARRLRGTGIRDLYVHTGPFRDDGTLDAALRPRAGWLVAALHRAAPGVRVQAWLGGATRTGRLDLGSAATRGRLVSSVRQVLDDGFDGVHYDFEPVQDGDAGLPPTLSATRAVTRGRHRLLSVSAPHLEPAPGLHVPVGVLPGTLCLWSAGYLHRIALRVDQVAVMSYDTGLPTAGAYAGDVRRQTTVALSAVPAGVDLLIGVPAYHEDNVTHRRSAETVPAALRGIRLALGAHPPRRPFGVALYVDFAATAGDWSSYRSDWST